jgi:hypothetical protein
VETEMSINAFNTENSDCKLSDSKAKEEVMKALRIPQITVFVEQCRKQLQGGC